MQQPFFSLAYQKISIFLTIYNLISYRTFKKKSYFCWLIHRTANLFYLSINVNHGKNTRYH